MPFIDPAHLHLILNHIPVLGSFFALILLAIGLLLRRCYLQKLGLAIIVVAAIVALPVFFTGEPAEEAVEHLSGVVESTIDIHQSAANIAFASVLAAGTIGLGALFLSRGGRQLPRPAAVIAFLACLVTAILMARTANLGGPRPAAVIAFLACLVTAILMARTANLGGKIRHSEISSGTVSNVQPEKPNHDEDD